MTSTHHHGPSSTAPRVHLHQARRQPRVLLQVCLAWYLAADACSSIPPPLRPRLCVAPSGLFAQKLLGSNFEEGRQAWLPLPAMHTRLRRAIIRFVWSRVAWSPWTWRKAGSHGRSFFGLGHGHSIGGGFAPGLGAGLPWRRCKMQSRAKDGRTLHLLQGAWFEPFGQHVLGDA